MSLHRFLLATSFGRKSNVFETARSLGEKSSQLFSEWPGEETYVNPDINIDVKVLTESLVYLETQKSYIHIGIMYEMLHSGFSVFEKDRKFI
uniref:Uncharacterized protein n=1 Tax=viral metagenome TaxID=1070528 RepID=A0A6C0JRS2_9ZZZZ